MTNHIWNFTTIGGVKRVNITSGNDLVHLKDLDQKLWTALSCPASDLEIDATTLKLIDGDGNDQIRAPEVIAAVNWIISLINNPNNLLDQRDYILFDEINQESDEGKLIYKSAKNILINLNKPNADRISIEDTSDLTAIFKNTAFNGDGVITTSSTTNDSLKSLIELIGVKYGTVADRSGEDGITAQHINDFFADAAAYKTWQYKQKENSTVLLPFGSNTHDAYNAYVAIYNKLEDYFIRCKLVDYDADVLSVLNPMGDQLTEVRIKNLAEFTSEISVTPLAKPNAKLTLNLNVGINPVWENQLNLFSQQVVQPLFNNATELSYLNWLKIKEVLTPYADWQSAMPNEKLTDCTNLDAIATKVNFDALMQLVANDIAVAEEANGILAVDKLLRFQKYLFVLLQNFVTFYDFYTPGKIAIFQAGTLYIDQRSCDLCIKVNEMEKHNMLAALSGLYLLYCRCISNKSGEEMHIVAALTNGDIDNIIEGRNAIFYDRAGNDWDATVIKIVENPISIRQAFFTPYRKAARFIEQQVNNLAQEQDNKIDSTAAARINETTATATAATEASAAPEKAPQTPFDIGKFVGIFAAIGLAIGAIGSTLTAFLTGFLGLVWWKIPFAIAGILLVISGPSMIMAYIKLRKRNLAPLLDANGWAINANVNINISFGNTLTSLAQLPPNSSVNYFDPFKNKSIPWYKWVIMAIIVALIIYALYHFKVAFVTAPANLTP